MSFGAEVARRTRERLADAKAKVEPAPSRPPAAPPVDALDRVIARARRTRTLGRLELR